jgi:hypothetical protein
MSNTIANFQADVGKANSTINLLFSYIFGAILIIISIVLVINAFIPREDSSCQNDPTKKKPCPKKRNYVLLWGLILIPIAVCIIYISKIWNHLVITNKNVAIADGTMAEVGWFSNLFNRNN